MQTNRLFFGDNLTVLRDRIPDESVDLLYIDPPFNSSRNYFVLFKDRTGKASQAQEQAFEDTWTWNEQSELWYRELLRAPGHSNLSVAIEALRRMLKESAMMAYLVAMAIRIVEMHRVLKNTGSFYLHCDPTAGAYLKVLLDTIFGPDNFRNEVVWKRSYGHGDSTRSMGRSHDLIFYYTKSDAYTLNRFFHAHDPKYIETFFRHEDERGRYKLENLTSPSPRPNLTYEYKGYPPPAKGWRINRERMEELDAQNRLHFPNKADGRIMKRVYLHELEGQPMTDVWTDVKPLSAFDAERLGYPTQKPLSLMERIIEASSKPGDVVMDCFCGCGTTVTAAHKLGREWIGIDVAPVAVSIIKSRMEHIFEAEGLKVSVDGFPTDFEGARHLFEIDSHRFQLWACTLIGAYPLTKKGKDDGIDGWLPFVDYGKTEKDHRAVVQVKGGKNLGLSQVRDFCHVVDREKATLGFLVCMGEVTKAMQQEAVKMGHWQSAGGNEYPRVQLLRVEDLLNGTARPRLPQQEKKSLLGYKAPKGERKGQQTALFD